MESQVFAHCVVGVLIVEVFYVLLKGLFDEFK